MKAAIQYYYKALSLAALFVKGLLIAGIQFPVINVLYGPGRAKQIQDTIKLGWLRQFGSIVGLRVHSRGAVPEASMLVVCNHISWLDIIVLGQTLPGCFVAKSDIGNWPIIGFLSARAGAIFIRRGDKKQIVRTTEAMAWQLRKNGNIIAFPEGTTTSGSQVLDFHPSLFQPALLAQKPIVPVAIKYTGEALHKAPFIGDDEFMAHLLKMLKMETIDAELTILPVIEGTGKSRHQVSSHAKHLIENIVVGNAALPLSSSKSGIY